MPNSVFVGAKHVFAAFDDISGQVFHAAHAKQTQPAKNDNPPNGVIAPNHLVPLTLIRYRLPEKRTVPMTNSHPPVVTSEEGHFDCIQAAAISAKA